MKKYSAMFLAIAVLFGVFPYASNAVELLEASAVITESTVIRKADPEILGVGSEWSSGNSKMMKSETSLEISDEFAKGISGIKYMPLARTAGSSLNNFFWKNSVGEYENRKTPGAPGVWYFTGDKINFGPVEWIRSSLAADENCKFVVGINVYNESPQLNGEYAEFMTGDANTSKLGALRAQCGIENPVDVFAYELGNELDGSLSAEEYCKRIKTSIKEIKKADPDAKFIACGKTYPVEYNVTSDEWRNWHKTILKEVGGEIDYISYHAYYDGVGMAIQEKYLDMISSDIQDITGSNRIKLVITEQAKWSEVGVESYTNALTGCISTADFLIRMYNRSDVAGANYYCYPGTLDGQWGFIGKGVDEEKWYLSGIGKLYNDFGDNLGDYVLKSDINLPSELKNKVSLLAMSQENGKLKLALSNKSADYDVDINFDFENAYTLTSQTVFTADDINAKILGKDTENAIYSTTTEKNEVDFSSFVLPAKSVVFLALERENETAINDAAVYAVTDDMETYDEMDGFLTGPGKNVGNWRTSSVYKGYGDSTKIKSGVDPADETNMVLVSNGGANPSCTSTINFSGDRTQLDSRHFAQVQFSQTHYSFYIGLRTMVHDNEKSYYELLLEPQYTKAKFRKVENGEIKYEKTFVNSTNRAGDDNTLKITMNKNVISYSIGTKHSQNWVSGIFFDETPFELSGNNTGVALNISGDAGLVYADNFVLSNIEAETRRNYAKRTGKYNDYEEYVSSAINAFNSAADKDAMKLYLTTLADRIMEYDYYQITDLADDVLESLAQKLVTYSPVECRDVFETAEKFEEITKREIMVAVIESADKDEIKSVLSAYGDSFGIIPAEGVFAQYFDEICESLCLKTFKNADDLKKTYEKEGTLAFLKGKNTADRINEILAEKEYYIGFNRKLYNKIPDKTAFAQKLITAASGFTSPDEIALFIDSYIPAAEEFLQKTVYSDDFENYELMEEPFYGQGAQIGNWRNSHIFGGYENKNYIQIASDPTNAENRVIKANGCGINFPSCTDLTVDTSTAENQTVGVDIYRENSGHFIFGLRTKVNYYELDYYEVSFPVYNGTPVLRKVVDNKTVFETTFSDKISGNAWYRLELSVIGNAVKGEIKNSDGETVATASFTDESPFECETAKTQLLVQGDGGCAYFDNFEIKREEKSSVFASMPQTAMFENLTAKSAVTVARNAQNDVGYAVDGDENTVYSSKSSYFIIDLKEERILNRLELINSAATAAITVSASADGVSYEQIAYISSSNLSNGNYGLLLNNQKDKYRYLKINSSKAYEIGEIKVLADIEEKMLDVFVHQPIYIEMYIDGDPVSVSDADICGNLLKQESASLTPQKDGVSRVLINDNSGKPHCFYINAVQAEKEENSSKAAVKLGSGYYTQNAQFIAAFYGKNGRFISASVLADKTAINKNIKTSEIEFDIPQGCIDYKIMCWDGGYNSILPLAPVYKFTYGE